MRWYYQVIALVLILLAGVAGLAAGARWHKELSPKKKTAAAKQLWWDPMLGPASISKKPGISAMGMKLVPYHPQKGHPGEVTVDPAIRQDMGVQTARVRRINLRSTVHTVGYVRVPQGNMSNINLKIGGYIEKLYANTDGEMVSKGQKLFTLYSPQLLVAEEEMLTAQRGVKGLGKHADPALARQAKMLLSTAKRRLRLWGIGGRVVAKVLSTGHAMTYVPFYSPFAGEIMDKKIVEGSFVKPGQQLMTIANHSVVWINAHIFSQQLPWVTLGQRMTARVDGLPGKRFGGKVIFISPTMDLHTRTVVVRCRVKNPEMVLKPGMFARVRIRTKALKHALAVPHSAVLETGRKNIVFIAEKHGHFLPRRVKLGVSGAHGMVQIRHGLKQGERVVTSGEFLLDVESSTNEAISKFAGAKGGS